MLFKISNEKMDRYQPENSLTFVNTHLPDLEFKEEGKKSNSKTWFRKWVLYILISMLCLTLIWLTFGSIHWLRIHRLHQNSMNDENICTDKHRSGRCIPFLSDFSGRFDPFDSSNSFDCCDGHSVIGKSVCNGQGFCCLGHSYKCKENKIRIKSAIFSQELTKILYRNVNEHSLINSISSCMYILRQSHYRFDEQICEKIEKTVNQRNGYKWFCLIASKDTVVDSKQFSVYIQMTINEFDIILFKIVQTLQTISIADYSTHELSDGNKESDIVLELNEQDYELDSRPTIQILRNEMIDSMKEFTIQTIDYVLNSCSNSYSCFTIKLIQALDEQFNSKGSQWQSIIISNTGVERMAVDIDFLRGYLLDVIYKNKHRIIVYKIEQNRKISELDVIRSGRKALYTNRTHLLEDSVGFKEKNSGLQMKSVILEEVYRAVQFNDKFITICNYLTSVSNKYSKNGVCFAGPRHSFGYVIRKEWPKNHLIFKLDELLIILFEKTCN